MELFTFCKKVIIQLILYFTKHVFIGVILKHQHNRKTLTSYTSVL